MKHFLALLAATLFFSAADARLPDLIPYRQGKLWGYCDSTKKIKIECRFDNAPLFENYDSVLTSYNGQTGYVRKDGAFHALPQTLTVVSPYIYPWAQGISWSGIVWTVAAFDCNVLHAEYDSQTEKIGYKRCGSWVIPPKYAQGRGFSDGVAVVQLQNEKWGAIDTTGKLLFTAPEGCSELGDFKRGSAVIQTVAGFGLINKQGWFLMPPMLNSLVESGNYLIAHNESTGYYTLLNRSGQMAYPAFSAASKSRTTVISKSTTAIITAS